MDSSPVLCQQSQNKIQSDFQRLRNVQNKMPVQPVSVKPSSAPHHSKQNENRDPANSETGKKAPVRPGVSRLPVPVKNLRLHTPSEFSQSHCKWEEKPLTGKAKKKKPYTRPIPFNLSQPKSSRVATENEQLLTVSQSRTATRAVHPTKNICNDRLKAPNSNSKLTKHPATLDSNVDSAKGAGKSRGKTPQPPGQCVPSAKSKTSANSSHPPSSVSNDTLPQNNAASSAQACVDNMNLLSLRSPTKTPNAPQNMQLRAEGKPSKSSDGKGENFQPDHAALLSILRNEGISSAGVAPVTPKSKPYNYLPQRVSVMKSRQKAGPTAGLMKADHFSPDCAALQSILQNEGVKAGSLLGATPRQSVCPSGRSTSVYTAQRVPARKPQAEAPGGPAAVELKEAAVKKWTPQRIRNTKHQPMSAMKWHLSTPYSSTPGTRSVKTNLQPHQEEVVQRLFDDQEDEQGTDATDRNPEMLTDQPPDQVATIQSDDMVEMSDAKGSKDEEERKEEVQPFIQAPQRESVIFFSTGKKLLRAPCFAQHEGSAHQEQIGQISSELQKVLQAHDETPSVSEPTCWITRSVLHREPNVQKTCVLSSAVAMLRKRFPPLEELRMDEEVATYTSVSVPAASGFIPPRPRCGNPLASILHFEESSLPAKAGALLDLPHVRKGDENKAAVRRSQWVERPPVVTNPGERFVPIDPTQLLDER